MALGALLQTIIVLTLPARYSLLPLLGLLLQSAITSLLQANSTPFKTTYNQSVIRGRHTAQLPNTNSNSRSTTLFGPTPASHSFVVLHIGIRYNHPLGFLAPGASAAGEYFLKMVDTLNNDPTAYDTYGLLPGAQTFRGGERAANNTSLLVMYFRDMAGLTKFALEDSTHRGAMEWWRTFSRTAEGGNVGIYHEVFEVGEGGYETVYDNMPPTLLGAANVRVASSSSSGAKVDGEREEEEWVGTLVSAEHPALRGGLKRMRREGVAA